MKNKILIGILTVLLSIFVLSCDKGKADEESTKNAENKIKQTEQSIKKARKSKVVPVEIMIAKKADIQATVPFTGILAPIHAVDIVAEVSGKVEKVNKKLGHRVTTADVLAVIDDKVPFSQYRQAQSQVLSAENNLKIAELNLKSDKTLFENEDISKLAYENSLLTVKTAEANKLSAEANLSLMEKNYNNTRIQSPFAGIISRKHIELGTMVNPNTPVYRVVDINTLKIEIGISQDLINHVKTGSQAEIKISALSNKNFTGYVRYVSPQADENSGTFKAEIHVKNTSDMKIRAGMTAKINLNISNGGKRLSVPDYALVSKNGESFIYKIKRNKAELLKIETGESIGDNIIINSGLTIGDSIVVVGMKSLGESTPVYIETVH